MGYTDDVRRILLRTEIRKECCRKTELFLLSCLVCGSYRLPGEDVFVPVKSDALLSRVRYLSSKLLGPERFQEAFPESLPDGFFISPLRAFFADTKYDLAENFPVFAEEPCCRAAALRAFFDVKGTVSDPGSAKWYVEVYFGERKLAEAYSEVLASFSIKSGVSLRRGKYVCYIKNADGISGFLALTGAVSESIAFSVKKTEREVSNNVNRVLNCDLANIDRSGKCSEQELAAIKILREKGGFYSLPDQLRNLARLRLDNPDLTHSELGSLFNPPVSGSLVSMRMKQILDVAGEAEKKT